MCRSGDRTGEHAWIPSAALGPSALSQPQSAPSDIHLSPGAGGRSDQRRDTSLPGEAVWFIFTSTRLGINVLVMGARSKLDFHSLLAQLTRLEPPPAPASPTLGPGVPSPATLGPGVCPLARTARPTGHQESRSRGQRNPNGGLKPQRAAASQQTHLHDHKGFSPD